MGEWEIRVGYEWEPLGVVGTRCLEYVQQNDLRVGKASVQGQAYEYDIDKMTQKDLESGRVLKIRRVQRQRRRSRAESMADRLGTRVRALSVFMFKPQPVAVRLHVYDVTQNTKIRTANGMLHMIGSGAYHAALEVYGLEWSYGFTHEEGTGVFWCEPTKCTQHHYRQVVELGTMNKSKATVDELLDELSVEWQGLDYDFFRKNCCHFCDEFAQRLGLAPIPAWISSLAATAGKLDDVIAKGVEMREGEDCDGFAIGSYRFGDVTRGLTALGKESRGADIMAKAQCGDCSRGVAKICFSDEKSLRHQGSTGSMNLISSSKPLPGDSPKKAVRINESVEFSPDTARSEVDPPHSLEAETAVQAPASSVPAFCKICCMRHKEEKDPNWRD